MAVEFVPYSELSAEQKAIIDGSDIEACVDLAVNGKGLDALANSRDYLKRRLAAKAGYELDSLIADREWEVRLAVAEQGYGLDILRKDPSEKVRRAVACQNFALESLVYDSSAYVRQAVIEQGYGLDILLNDPEPSNRRAIAKQGYGLDTLANDPDPSVRAAVAEMGYGLDSLVNDKVGYVRTAASLAKAKLEHSSRLSSIAQEETYQQELHSKAENDITEAIDVGSSGVEINKPGVGETAQGSSRPVITVNIKGGSYADYEKLIALLESHGALQDMQFLRDCYDFIVNIENEAEANNQNLFRRLKDIKDKTAFQGSAMTKETHEKLNTWVSHLETSIGDHVEITRAQLSGLKQEFFDTCKGAIQHIKTFGYHAISSFLQFVPFRSAFEGVQNSTEKMKDYFTKSSIEWKMIDKEEKQAILHLKNAGRLFIGKEPKHAASGDLGVINSLYVKLDAACVKTAESLGAKMSHAIDIIDSTATKDEFNHLVDFFGVRVETRSDRDGNLVPVFASRNIQNVYNAIETNPEIIYKTHKNEIDPDGSRLDFFVSGLQHGSFELAEAYAEVIYESFGFASPRSRMIEPIPEMNEAQFDLAISASSSYDSRAFNESGGLYGYHICRHPEENTFSNALMFYAKSGMFDIEQIEEIAKALKDGLNVDMIANPNFSAKKMEDLRYRLMERQSRSEFVGSHAANIGDMSAQAVAMTDDKATNTPVKQPTPPMPVSSSGRPAGAQA